MRLEVEVLHDGQAEHKQDAAVDVQQQANYVLKKKQIEKYFIWIAVNVMNHSNI